MVPTAKPCWMCSGLIRHFGIVCVVVSAVSGIHDLEWFGRHDMDVHRLADPKCGDYRRKLLAEGAR